MRNIIDKVTVAVALIAAFAQSMLVEAKAWAKIYAEDWKLAEKLPENCKLKEKLDLE